MACIGDCSELSSKGRRTPPHAPHRAYKRAKNGPRNIGIVALSDFSQEGYLQRMNNISKPSSSQICSELSRSLRAFLAQGRLGQVSANLWYEVKRKLLSSLATEHVQTIQSALTALKKERTCVSNDGWLALEQQVQGELGLCGRRQLLDELVEKVFDATPRTSSAQAKKRTTPPTVDSTPVKKRPRSLEATNAERNRVDILSSSPLHLDTFYLLRSKHIPNKEHTVALDEIVTAGADLTVVCNYKFDVPWMWDRAPALQTSRKLLIVHGESEAEEQEWRSFLNGQGALQRVRFARPRTPSYGTVHSKMFLQFFPTGCRVCVHTANMVAGDWDFKTQGAYVRDFSPRERNDIQTKPRTNTLPSVEEDDFKTQLDRYFRHALVGDMREELVRSIAKYDFSSAGVALISSVPGVHRGFSKTHFGHARLRELLLREKIPASRSKSVAICQFSSLGSIQQKWLDEEFKETLFSSAERCNPNHSGGAEADEIKLVFPTLHQVRQSNEGLHAGASLPVSGKNLHRDHIMSRLHKWDARQSGYERAMPHIKTFLRYPASQPQSPFWTFLGSFNLSVAAWGRMQGGRKGRSSWDRLNVLSYEVGVLFSPALSCPPQHSIDGSIKYSLLSPGEKFTWNTARKDLAVSMEASLFGSELPERKNCVPAEAQTRAVLTLPLPYRLPPPKYDSSDVPWTTEFCTIA